ncbi:MAG: hypothetical protein JWM05_2770 [Acidimicrobiales bacterium]|nr:hypothetical protein [Acidimicrobiales bacterium]
MSDIEIVRSLYAAMAERDIDRLFELIDPKCVITQDPRLPWGGRHVGHDGFATFGMTLGETIESSVAIDAIFATDDEVIQVGRTRGHVRANGVSFDLPEVHRWKLRKGKAISGHFAIDTAAMLYAIYSPAVDPAD